MGLGKFINGRYWPITQYKGSWAYEEAQRKLGKGPPLVKPEPLDKYWVTIGPCDSKGNLIKPKGD